MKTKQFSAIVCYLLWLQAIAAEKAPIMWPHSFGVKKDTPFVYPLEEIGVKFERAIKLMDGFDNQVSIKCNGVVVAESTTLEVINYEGVRNSEGTLCVHFEKQNLPKGETYEICIPEGVVGSIEEIDGWQLVNAASSAEFSVPSSLGLTQGTHDGEYICDSKHSIVVYWGYETKGIGQPMFHLYREDEKIADLPAAVSWDWNLGQARPVFNDYMVFENGVKYKLVLPAGTVSSQYRDDITNDEVIINFIGSYSESSQPFTYIWCSLYSDHSASLQEVAFTYDRPIEIAPDAKVQLFEIYPREQLIMEVTPWISLEANCWTLKCDFGGYQRDDEWGYTIVIPEGAIISADQQHIKCVRSEYRMESTAVDSLKSSEDNCKTLYNLQGLKVDRPKTGNMYIQNGKKIIFR